MSKPIRIQLSRKKGWRKPENTIVVARPGKWGNPFKIGQPGIATRADAVARYRTVMTDESLRYLNAIELPQLRGKNLACWCPLNQPCHADVLLEIANA